MDQPSPPSPPHAEDPMALLSMALSSEPTAIVPISTSPGYAGADRAVPVSDAVDHRLSAADRRFREAFEACTLPPTEFDHRAHIRLAYVCLVHADADGALARVRSALQAYLRHHGIDPAKYHETLTRAWVLAVRHFMARTPAAGSADAFIDANPELLDPAIMTTHYSREVLFSREARERFVPPDIDPIPRSPGRSGSN